MNLYPRCSLWRRSTDPSEKLRYESTAAFISIGRRNDPPVRRVYALNSDSTETYAGTGKWKRKTKHSQRARGKEDPIKPRGQRKSADKNKLEQSVGGKRKVQTPANGAHLRKTMAAALFSNSNVRARTVVARSNNSRRARRRPRLEERGAYFNVQSSRETARSAELPL